jgi:hypothetical protein
MPLAEGMSKRSEKKEKKATPTGLSSLQLAAFQPLFGRFPPDSSISYSRRRRGTSKRASRHEEEQRSKKKMERNGKNGGGTGFKRSV